MVIKSKYTTNIRWRKHYIFKHCLDIWEKHKQYFQTLRQLAPAEIGNITQFCTISGSSKFFSIPSAKEIFHQIVKGEKKPTSISITNIKHQLNRWKWQHYVSVAMLYLNTDLNDCSLKLKVSVLCMANEFFSSFLSHLQYLKPFLFS